VVVLVDKIILSARDRDFTDNIENSETGFVLFCHALPFMAATLLLEMQALTHDDRDAEARQSPRHWLQQPSPRS
jgi:hypothetical protein